ncbi:phage tail assembly chaperone family protein, TAC [Acinetobacter sp. HY1485]|uniref:phage tail assembly chaperone family protein, TAC n=1 Tax=Acinetobacter sp. HY1485 TaxID=2970918 RepID=UPI0022B96CA7|nr:phage tail assembly chaperone family protein, TAC [Acinetobacter sp. HY1485]
MKKLTVESIKAGKLIGEPKKVEIKVSVDGEEQIFETTLKPFSYGTAVAHLRAFGEKREALAGILASSMLDENNKPQFTEEQIREHFSEELTNAVWGKIVEINALGKTSSSTQTTNSSAKSRSQRRKRSRKSNACHSQKSEHGQHTSENTAALTSDGASSKK